MNNNVVIVHTNGTNQDFVKLCGMLDESLDEIVGGPAKRKKYCPLNLLDDINTALVLYVNDEPVASGSYKHYNADIAEVKRIFVKEEHRGRGLSKIILKELEIKAKNAGYKKFYLETGELLAASMHLYKSIGFRIIDNYGPYISMEESVCMEKLL